MTCEPLPHGLYPQLYRDAIRDPDKLGAVKRFLDMLVPLAALVRGVAFHGFEVEFTPERFEALAAECRARNLYGLAAFGFGQGSSHHGKLSGERIADVVAHPLCRATLIDQEGAWEDEAEDKRNAREMGEALRAKAPDAYLIDQPWPVPTVHWSRFPWEETGAWVNERAPQNYYNDWKRAYGRERYAKCDAWFERSWARLDARLAVAGVTRPRAATIQLYEWDDIPADLVECLLTYTRPRPGRSGVLVGWSDPFPTATTMAGMRAVVELQRRGFVRRDATARDCVRAYQLDYNVAHPAAKLGEDGRCGKLTMASLGIMWP